MNRKKLTKSSTDRILSGVCGGFAEFFGISPLAIRLIFVLLASNILLYIILALIMPEE